MNIRTLSAVPPGEEFPERVVTLTAVEAQDKELLDAVSKSASSAATKVVTQGLVAYTAVAITAMVARKMAMGLIGGAVLITGVSFIASSSFKKD